MTESVSKPPDDREPRTSRYEVLGKIASGGMATVYVGRARGAVGFTRLVAIKRPHPFLSRDGAMRKSLDREARVASMIHHPHVVSILDVELWGDELALILDYVEGGTLDELATWARDGRESIPTGVAARILLDTASGLHAAHVLRDGGGELLGLVHRDVSPQNILVGLDGQARLTDFGIAKTANRVEQTATGVLKGKLGYLPPEYVASRSFDHLSDQFALAVVAWEAFAGRRWFGNGTDAEVLRQIAGGVVPPLSSVRPELEPLERVLTRALSRRPEDRYESVAAFADELEASARQYGWVAPHSEVGAFVDAAVGDRVRQRRSTIESRAHPPSSKVSLPSVARDAQVTASIPAGALPLPSKRSDPPAAEPTEEHEPDPTVPFSAPQLVLEATAFDAMPTVPLRRPGKPGLKERLAGARRWWPAVLVVAIAAVVGFVATRGLLAPARATPVEDSFSGADARESPPATPSPPAASEAVPAVIAPANGALGAPIDAPGPAEVPSSSASADEEPPPPASGAAAPVVARPPPGPRSWPRRPPHPQPKRSSAGGT